MSEYASEGVALLTVPVVWSYSVVAIACAGVMPPPATAAVKADAAKAAIRQTRQNERGADSGFIPGSLLIKQEVQAALSGARDGARIAKVGWGIGKRQRILMQQA